MALLAAKCHVYRENSSLRTGAAQGALEASVEGEADMQAAPESKYDRRHMTGILKLDAIAPARNDRDAETVFIIEDDISVREALCGLLQSVGLQVQAFAAPADLLGNGGGEGASCMVVDIRLPGMSGLDFQATLGQAEINTPIIFMTGHGDVPMTVRAMKAGAIDFLTKPFRDQDMLDAVATAIEHNRVRRSTEKTTAELRVHLRTLSRRERETMLLVTKGLMNKQAAGHLGLSECTVKMYRGQVMRKMGARSLAELVRMAEILGLHTSKSQVPSSVVAEQERCDIPPEGNSKALVEQSQLPLSAMSEGLLSFRPDLVSWRRP
jgi:FixJ family two-component response regulator